MKKQLREKTVLFFSIIIFHFIFCITGWLLSADKLMVFSLYGFVAYYAQSFPLITGIIALLVLPYEKIRQKRKLDLTQVCTALLAVPCIIFSVIDTQDTFFFSIILLTAFLIWFSWGFKLIMGIREIRNEKTAKITKNDTYPTL